MARMTVEDANKLLDGCEFLPLQFEAVFNDLRGDCERLLLCLSANGGATGEKLPNGLPPFAAAGAWRAWYGLYEKLKARSAKQEAQAVQVAPADTRWPDFLLARTMMLELIKRHSIDHLEQEYLGLRPDDLGSPTTDDAEIRRRFGFSPRADWNEVSSRISLAISKWQDLTPAQRSTIPDKLEIRRLVLTNERLEARITAIEEHLSLRLIGSPATEKARQSIN